MKAKVILICLSIVSLFCIGGFIIKKQENSNDRNKPLYNINSSVQDINKEEKNDHTDISNNDNIVTDSNGNEKKINIIEITPKNWNTYFEFADTVKWDYNDFNEVDGMSLRKVIKLKSDYHGKIAKDSNIAFEVSGIIVSKRVNIDYANKKYTIKSTQERFNKDTITTSLNLSQNSDREEASVYWCHDGYTFENNKKVMLIDVIEQLKMNRAQGTLYLYD